MTLKKWQFLPKTRSSHPVSKLLRPVLEIKKLKIALGGVMSAAGVSFSSLWLATGVYQSSRPVQAFAPPPTQAVIETKKQDYSYGLRRVLPDMSGVSQGFHGWHTAVDMTAPAGSKIRAALRGKVARIGNTRWGYGRSILIEHDGGLTSLYAHLGKIMVEEGDVVGPETVLAEVGLTGRTTGYHLHLEIRRNGRALSPVRFLNQVADLPSKI